MCCRWDYVRSIDSCGSMGVHTHDFLIVRVPTHDALNRELVKFG